MLYYLVTSAALLRWRLDIAIKEQAVQRQAFEAFSLQQADRVPVWKAMVELYERKPDEKNPYKMKISGTFRADRDGGALQFANEEAEEAKKGVPALHEVTSSSFINAGLDLEDQQRRVRVQAELKKAGTTAMQVNMKAIRVKLNHGICRFCKLQATYMPAALQVLSKRVAPEKELAEDVPLILPSALSEEDRKDAGCLRNQLHIKSRLLLYKKNNSRHQGMNTRSRTIVNRNESKIRLHSEKFQIAWEARLRLAGGDVLKVGTRSSFPATLRSGGRRTRDFYGELPPLPEDEEEEANMVTQGGENLCEISWIWTMAGMAGTDEELEDALRIEWAKAWARSRRWTEEVGLLQEEWKRLPPTYTHREREWIARKGGSYGKHSFPGGGGKGGDEDGGVKLQKGRKRRVVQPVWDPIIPVEERAAAESDNDNDNNDEDDDERGDIDSNKELLMGGEVEED
ncbi:hypothetical protein DFH06DRAFT_1149139 [Mycena polygramma]|nr:hypothetical protein DFH06DRAFT_1149139 [Mycena polygramma]